MIFRRQRQRNAESAAPSDLDELSAQDEAAPSAEQASTGGPYDVADVELDPEDPTRVDLGGLIVKGLPGAELRLQVDEGSGTVVAVLMVTEDSALELRPFAAPRHAGIWDDVRKEIAADATRRGGTATQTSGTYGPELRIVVPVKAPDGRPATQASRVVGVDGPRWLLRGTFLGRAGEQADPDSVLEQAFREVVVVRGGTPMAPREALPLALPGGTRLPDGSVQPERRPPDDPLSG